MTEHAPTDMEHLSPDWAVACPRCGWCFPLDITMRPEREVRSHFRPKAVVPFVTCDHPDCLTTYEVESIEIGSDVPPRSDIITLLWGGGLISRQPVLTMNPANYVRLTR